MRETLQRRYVVCASIVALVTVGGPWLAGTPKAAGADIMSGDFSAVVVTHFVDRELVQSWLPDGLILAHESVAGQHPVLIMLGRQKNLARTRRFKIYPRWGIDYLETFVAIPYLKIERAPEKPLVFHFVRVYLNNWPATEKGIRLFGWPKYCTTLRSCRDDYHVFFSRYGQVLDARTDFANSQPVAEDNESLNAIQRMLSTPMVLEKGGRLTAYRFDFHLDCARIRSVSTQLSIGEGFMPGLGANQLKVRGINDQEFGALHIVARFTNRKIRY